MEDKKTNCRQRAPCCGQSERTNSGATWPDGITRPLVH